VGTQWPTGNPDALQIKDPIEPALLANALLETYHQSTSSCMGCYGQARMLNNRYFADFVWALAINEKPKNKK